MPSSLTRRFLPPLLTLLALAMLASGCGRQAETPAPEPAPPPETSKAPEAAKAPERYVVVQGPVKAPYELMQVERRPEGVVLEPDPGYGPATVIWSSKSPVVR